jgi:hypothetical protein
MILGGSVLYAVEHLATHLGVRPSPRPVSAHPAIPRYASESAGGNGPSGLTKSRPSAFMWCAWREGQYANYGAGDLPWRTASYQRMTRRQYNWWRI